MKDIARSEVRRLIDDFPNDESSLMQFPTLATKFCESTVPTDMGELMKRRQALDRFKHLIDHERLMLRSRASR